MIYGFGGRVDNDSNAITVIDEENRTAETKGYVNGEYVEFSGGGGGSSDFSTAEVTITVSEAVLADELHWVFPIISSDKVVVGNCVQEELTETHSVVLYKGKCEAVNPVYSQIYTVTSGSALVNDSLITITGDCTISCSKRSIG